MPPTLYQIPFRKGYLHLLKKVFSNFEHFWRFSCNIILTTELNLLTMEACHGYRN